jgi:hypothetical protein
MRTIVLPLAFAARVMAHMNVLVESVYCSLD